MMFPDEYILERRLDQLMRLPWVVPSSVILEMTSEDLDALDMAQDETAYWRVLNKIVARIRDEENVETFPHFSGEETHG